MVAKAKTATKRETARKKKPAKKPKQAAEAAPKKYASEEAEFLARIREKQSEIDDAERSYLNAKGIAKARKEDWEERVAEQGVLIRQLDEKLPLFDGEKSPAAETAEEKKRGPRFSEPANGHANGEHVDWQAQGIEVLELPHQVCDALKIADLKTLGDVARFQEENGNVGIDEIKGMGGERGELLRELFGRYRTAHPDLFPELAEAGAS